MYGNISGMKQWIDDDDDDDDYSNLQKRVSGLQELKLLTPKLKQVADSECIPSFFWLQAHVLLAMTSSVTINRN